MHVLVAVMLILVAGWSGSSSAEMFQRRPIHNQGFVQLVPQRQAPQPQNWGNPYERRSLVPQRNTTSEGALIVPNGQWAFLEADCAQSGFAISKLQQGEISRVFVNLEPDWQATFCAASQDGGCVVGQSYRVGNRPENTQNQFVSPYDLNNQRVMRVQAKNKNNNQTCTAVVALVNRPNGDFLSVRNLSGKNAIPSAETITQ